MNDFYNIGGFDDLPVTLLGHKLNGRCQFFVSKIIIARSQKNIVRCLGGFLHDDFINSLALKNHPDLESARPKCNIFSSYRLDSLSLLPDSRGSIL